ncbi:MAG: IPTL-CTERM sorting domain-containing protein [Pseudomonadota bacterium]
MNHEGYGKEQRVMMQIGRSGVLGLVIAAAVSGDVLAGVAAPPPATAVPTLGEWGLAGIAALLAIAAGRALYRRRG